MTARAKSAKKKGARRRKSSRKPRRNKRPKVAGSSALLRLVAALVSHDSTIRLRLNRNRDLVCDEYGLSMEEREALSTMDIGEIARVAKLQIDALEDEIANYPMNPHEWPIEDENFLPDDGSGTMAYPDPKPAIRRIRPNRLRVGSWNDKGVEFVIFGQSFPNEVKIEVTRSKDSTRMNVSGASVLGSLRCSRAVATIPQGSADPDLDPGTYDVTLTLQPGSTTYKKVLTTSFEVLP